AFVSKINECLYLYLADGNDLPSSIPELRYILKTKFNIYDIATSAKDYYIWYSISEKRFALYNIDANGYLQTNYNSDLINMAYADENLKLNDKMIVPEEVFKGFLLLNTKGSKFVESVNSFRKANEIKVDSGFESIDNILNVLKNRIVNFDGKKMTIGYNSESKFIKNPIIILTENLVSEIKLKIIIEEQSKDEDIFLESLKIFSNSESIIFPYLYKNITLDNSFYKKVLDVAQNVKYVEGVDETLLKVVDETNKPIETKINEEIKGNDFIIEKGLFTTTTINGTYLENTQLELNAIALDNNYTLDKWMEIGINNEYLEISTIIDNDKLFYIMPNRNIKLVPLFKLKTSKLNLKIALKSNEAALIEQVGLTTICGIVVCNGAQIDNCAEVTSKITLIATANKHYEFLYWIVNGKQAVGESGHNQNYEHIVELTSNEITAVFKEIPKYTVNICKAVIKGNNTNNRITDNECGEINIKYGDIFSQTSITDIYKNENVSLSYTVNDGYEIVGYYNCNEKLNIINNVYTVTDEITITIVYKYKRYILNINKVCNNGGFVNKDECSVSGNSEFEYKSEGILTAHISTGYSFVKWTDVNGNELSNTNSSQKNEYKFVMGKIDYTINAIFALNSYSVIVPQTCGEIKNGNFGSIEAMAQGFKYRYGEKCKFTAVANEGYKFIKWSSNDIIIKDNTVNLIEFIMPNKDIEIVAYFESVGFTISNKHCFVLFVDNVAVIENEFITGGCEFTINNTKEHSTFYVAEYDNGTEIKRYGDSCEKTLQEYNESKTDFYECVLFYVESYRVVFTTTSYGWRCYKHFELYRGNCTHGYEGCPRDENNCRNVLKNNIYLRDMDNLIQIAKISNDKSAFKDMYKISNSRFWYINEKDIKFENNSNVFFKIGENENDIKTITYAGWGKIAYFMDGSFKNTL
ncbi:MAG: hypothetical protein RR316_04645, partial [Clostridia bacterium]